MILEGSVVIGLRWIPGITGLGEEAEVGEAEASNQGQVLLQGRTIGPDPKVGVQGQEHQHETTSGEKRNKETGFSYRD